MIGAVLFGGKIKKETLQAPNRVRLKVIQNILPLKKRVYV